MGWKSSLQLYIHPSFCLWDCHSFIPSEFSCYLLRIMALFLRLIAALNLANSAKDIGESVMIQQEELTVWMVQGSLDIIHCYEKAVTVPIWKTRRARMSLESFHTRVAQGQAMIHFMGP
mmetsp:Transcript_22355/g.66267  ORF Transcript_22355/g.66267 Transcript_22355/m.66267 type:complete len:119 (-) Transcript_22355:176-532(-)